MQRNALTNGARIISRLQHTQAALRSTPEYISQPEFVARSDAGNHDEQLLVESEYTPNEEAPAIRRSQAALDGSSRIGLVELPAELRLAVNRLIDGEWRCEIPVSSRLTVFARGKMQTGLSSDSAPSNCTIGFGQQGRRRNR